MPYILLGIGIFVVGMSILLPEKTNIPEGVHPKGSLIETASTSLNHNIDSKIDVLIDEFSESVHFASTELDSRISELAKLQDSINSSLVHWQETLKKAQAVDEKQQLPQKHKDVLMYNKKGLNITEIASRMNIGKGEVELILALYEAGDSK